MVKLEMNPDEAKNLILGWGNESLNSLLIVYKLLNGVTGCISKECSGAYIGVGLIMAKTKRKIMMTTIGYMNLVFWLSSIKSIK